jgi:hypothetical protein
VGAPRDAGMPGAAAGRRRRGTVGGGGRVLQPAERTMGRDVRTGGWCRRARTRCALVGGQQRGCFSQRSQRAQCRQKGASGSGVGVGVGVGDELMMRCRSAVSASSARAAVECHLSSRRRIRPSHKPRNTTALSRACQHTKTPPAPSKNTPAGAPVPNAPKSLPEGGGQLTLDVLEQALSLPS